MSPSWALRGPISFTSGAISSDALEGEKNGLEVVVVSHPNPYSRTHHIDAIDK